MVRCPSCGEQSPAGKKFCGECGGPLLNAAAPAREVRKTVTILFSDVSGSTALGEQLDPESLRAVMGRYFAAMKSVIERHGGTVEKFIGDAVMAVFGIPVLHEDDALRAVRAAAEMRDALDALNRELEAERGVRIAVRTGINTGEVVAGDPSAGQTLVTGDSVNTAARLEQAATAGEILLGESTHRLVRDAVHAVLVEPLELKGKSLPVDAYRLLTVTAGAEAHTRRLDSPLVGRERELDLLRSAHGRAVAERSAQLFTLLGTAGVGKSRLVAEFVAAASEEASVLRGRCLPYGEGITYWPVGEVVKQAAGVDETDDSDRARRKIAALLAGERDAEVIAARIEAAIGLTTEAVAQEEIFWAIRKLLEHLARARPLVVVWEDIHWAEPTFLDLVEHIADWSRNAPLLLLCPARPELLDARPSWGGGKMNATTILLEPLPAEAASRLIDNLPGGSALDERTRKRIAEAAEGNPLFVEEMLAMLVDDGYVQQSESSGWKAARDLTSVRVPPSISALLAARLDRLGADERAVAETAAVVGRVFERSAVKELAPRGLREGVTAHLLGLVRKDLVRPDEPGLGGDDAFRFRHILIRDAAYDALPKSERAELHERFADWLEGATGDRSTEYAEILGHHLEQAHRYRSELGETGGRVEALALRAGEHLASTGQHALDRGDIRAAAELLERALGVVPGDVHRPAWRALLADALALGGAFDRAFGEYDAAIDDFERMGDDAGALRARVERSAARLSTGAETLTAVERVAREAIPVFNRSGDAAGLASAWGVLFFTRGDMGDSAGAAQAMEQRLIWGRKAGERGAEAQQLARLARAFVLGPEPALAAVARAKGFRAESASSPRAQASIDASLSELCAMIGRFDEARTYYRSAIARLDDLGDHLRKADATGSAAIVESLAGNARAAEKLLQASAHELEARGETYYLSSVAGVLSDLLAASGSYDEAERYVALTRESASEDDFHPQVLWRRALATVLSARKDYAEAERLLIEAASIADTTDDLNTRADTAVTFAESLVAAGRVEEGVRRLQAAITLYEQKENLVAAAKARARLADLSTGHAPRPLTPGT